MSHEYKCASFFAGVGGIDLAFRYAGFETIYANEINEFPIETYEANHPTEVDDRDICEVHENEIPNFNIMLAGFPCQPFSIAGKREGFEDEKGRGNLFFELIRIIHAKQPEIVFLENVKGLVNHDEGRTFFIILNSLQKEGYFVKYQILNTKSFGNLPQNRERIYIVAFKDKAVHDAFEFPKIIKRTKTLQSVIDFETKMNDRYYYTDEKFKYFDILEECVRSNETVYQWRRKYARENKSNLCPTLTNNMGTGGHNVPLILTDAGIRKLSPKECLNFQGFPQKYQFPENIPFAACYKQAGNSVVVPLIQKVCQQICMVILENS